MTRTVRLALVVLGLAVAVYAVASLTGRWLGTPPRWGEWVASELAEMGGDSLQDEAESELRRRHPDQPRPAAIRWSWDSPTGGESLHLNPHRGRISAGVIVAGLAMAAFAAWPRRRRPVASV